MKTKEEIEYTTDNFVNDFIKINTNTDKKYTEEDVINIVNKSRETGLTAEYLILQLNKQD
jgi:hypothetical protein